MALWSALFPKPTRAPTHTRPSLFLFFLLAGAFLLTLVPHVVQFPIWLTITVVCAMIIRSFIEYYRLPLPSTTLTSFFALVFLGLIIAQYSTVTGRDAGTAFTAGLLTIKFYELRRPRDVALVIFSCFFMVMSALLYSQVLELFIYCLIMMWILTALLLRVHTGDLANDRLLQMLERSGTIFLQALPLALFLFFAFPRYTGKLALNLDEPTVGLTDTVSPGSIAKLSKNDAEAMYVQFPNPIRIPITSAMYWRALVLWDYKDGKWTQGEFAAMQLSNVPATAGPDKIKQEITIKPHSQKWLFALDLPASLPINTAESQSWASVHTGNVLELSGSNKLDHTARYTVFSDPSPEEDSQTLSGDHALSAVRLPNGSNDHIDPAVIALADRLHQGLTDDQRLEYVYAVLRYFHRGGFIYSTTPGIQGPDWLTNFLFKTKAGFCEHFASAFAVLMRLEKIPTRLVVGYLGAEYNPYNDHYIVSQSNAHAWDEVWFPAKDAPAGSGRGVWKRFDPTGLTSSGEETQSNNRSELAADTLSAQLARHEPTFSEKFLPEWMRDSLKEVQLRREQVETNWDNIVFSYDPEIQNRWAQALGFGPQANFKLLLISFAAGGVCLLIFRKWVAKKSSISPVENLYASFCHSMARRGIPRAAWEGPLAYTGRVAEAFPEEQLTIHRFGSIVARARYGPVPVDASTPHALQSLLNGLTASQAATASRERR
jgi:transglutaminase-like putative cysteine protease